MNNCLLAISPTWIVAIVVIALAVVLCIVIGYRAIKAKKKIKLELEKAKDNGVTEIDGERYTSDSALLTKGEGDLTYLTSDIILKMGETYTANACCGIKPGKYTILSADDNTKVFNIRLGAFVREYASGTDIVIAEGDTICAVSHNVILR